MKYFLLLFLFPLFLSCNNNRVPQKFSIEIHRWGLMKGGDKITVINQDSIFVQSMNFADTGTSFRKILTPAERQMIAKSLSEIDLDKLQKDYTNKNAPDDMGEYDFKISVDQKTRAFHIYQEKVPGVFNLVKTINTLLPADEKIGYDESYFGIY